MKMGSSISKIYDDHETYVEFCKLLKEESLDVQDKFYTHEEELMKKHGYVRCGCWYAKKSLTLPGQPGVKLRNHDI